MSKSLEERLAALEERLELESGLRASIDRDLAAIAQRQSAANHLIQALSITQSEHTETLTQHTETLAQHTDQLVSANAKLDQIISLLERLIDGRP